MNGISVESSRESDGVPLSSLPAGRADQGFPVRLKIPSIKVDAAIVRVGLTVQGVVDVPKSATSAAWFDLGPRPGEKGSSIIDGHFGWLDHIPAVFNDLHTLHTGDKIYIEDEKGATTNFVVREFRTYGLHDDVTEVFGSSDGQAHLNLITCKGDWNKVSKSFSKRLVVFTDKEV